MPIDFKALTQSTEGISVLYVEDDQELREQTGQLLGKIFPGIVTATNGQEGLDAFMAKPYDLVITDIQMPRMDGIAMAHEMLKASPAQPIVVTSAHNDAAYLTELINIGVSRFVSKPLAIEKFFSTLEQVCQDIRNRRMVEAYRKELEEANEELTAANTRLEKLVRLFETRFIKERLQAKKAKKEPDAPETKEERGGIKRFDDYVLENDVEELREREGEIDSLAVLFSMNSQVPRDQVIRLASHFLRYGAILSNYPVFEHLGKELETLGKTLEEKYPFPEGMEKDIFSLMESFVYVLGRWRSDLFDKGVEDPHAYDASMISDMHTMVLLMDPPEDSGDEDDIFF